MPQAHASWSAKSCWRRDSARVGTASLPASHCSVRPETLASSKAQYGALRTSLEPALCVIGMICDERGADAYCCVLEIDPVFTAHTGHVDPVSRTSRALVPELEDQWMQLYTVIAAFGEAVRSVSQSPAMRRWFDVFTFRIDDPAARRVAVLASDVTKPR